MSSYHCAHNDSDYDDNDLDAEQEAFESIATEFGQSFDENFDDD